MTLYATAEQLADFRQGWEPCAVPAFYKWKGPMGPPGTGPAPHYAVCLHCGLWIVRVTPADLSNEEFAHGRVCDAIARAES